MQIILKCDIDAKLERRVLCRKGKVESYVARSLDFQVVRSLLGGLIL